MNAILTQDEMQAMLAKLQAENAALKAAKNGKLTLKVSEKGAISIYGMGKWPITMYRGQWERVFANADQINAFVQGNEAVLSVKA